MLTILNQLSDSQLLHGISYPINVVRCLTYDGELVNKLQVAIQHKTYDIRTWRNNVYFSTYPPGTVMHLSRYQCAETRSTEVFRLLSQPLPHLRFNLFVISEIFATQL
jgi:hypothetical protein